MTMDREQILREYAREEITNMTMEDLVQWYNRNVLDRKFFPNGDIFNVCDRDTIRRVVSSIDSMTVIDIISRGGGALEQGFSKYDEWLQYDEDNQMFRSFDSPQDLFDKFGLDILVSAYVDSMPMKKVREIWSQEKV